jgi:hypothetical protein
MEPASESSAHTGDGVTTPPKHVKPALKKNPAHSSGAKPGASSARKKKKGLKWDEEVIAEHDQLRGTRMKVRFSRSSVSDLLLKADLCFGIIVSRSTNQTHLITTIRAQKVTGATKSLLGLIALSLT